MPCRAEPVRFHLQLHVRAVEDYCRRRRSRHMVMPIIYVDTMQSSLFHEMPNVVRNHNSRRTGPVSICKLSSQNGDARLSDVCLSHPCLLVPMMPEILFHFHSRPSVGAMQGNIEHHMWMNGLMNPDVERFQACPKVLAHSAALDRY